MVESEFVSGEGGGLLIPKLLSHPAETNTQSS